MELPLAVPLIVAGLRIAGVSTIGIVTISGILGDRFGGLGFFIFEGYHRAFPTEIYAGAVPSILLASPSTSCSCACNGGSPRGRSPRAARGARRR